MGQDYSYSQPDSSDQNWSYSSEDTKDREIEALIQMDQQNMFFDETRQYPPQPEVEHGFPKVCYCGAQPFISSCYNRRFFTCPNVDDGEMHIHKWWDVAVMEEMRDVESRYQVMAEKVDYLTLVNDYDADIIQVRDYSFAVEQRMVHLETLVSELRKNGNRFRKLNLCLVVAVIVLLVGVVVRRLV